MFRNTLRSFLPYLRRYRREITAGMAALLLTDLIHLCIPWLVKAVVDLLPQKPSGGLLLQYAGGLLLASVLIAVFRFGWRKYLFGPSRKIEFDILNRLMEHFLSLDRAWYQQQNIGDLMSRATNDLRSVREFAGLGLLILLDSTVVTLACLGLMLYINPQLALYCLLPMPVVSLLFFKFSGTIAARQRRVQAHLSKITTLVQENLAGIRVLHAFVQEENEKRKFDRLNREYIGKNLDLTRLYALFTPSLVFTLGVAALISLWLGSRAVIAGEMTLGAFVAFNGYLMMLSWPMMGIGYVFNLSQRGLGAMARLNEIFAGRSSLLPGKSDGPFPPIRGEIEFRGVNFRYSRDSELCLKDVRFRVSAGSRVVFVGSIGSGKTTLVQLLPRLFDAAPGTLLVDGVPIHEIPLNVLRRSIGFVSQEPFLFSMTLRENIALGREDATGEQVMEVIRLAGLEPDLARFPGGLGTVVGERGVSLSGGQKQRVALARALIKKPAILILDDAFSSLDVETEEIILRNIHRYVTGVTTLIVTHRLTAVREADRIVVLDRGRVVEMGKHAGLIRHDGLYRKIYKNQTLAREMEIFMQ